MKLKITGSGTISKHQFNNEQQKHIHSIIFLRRWLKVIWISWTNAIVLSSSRALNAGMELSIFRPIQYGLPTSSRLVKTNPVRTWERQLRCDIQLWLDEYIFVQRSYCRQTTANFHTIIARFIGRQPMIRLKQETRVSIGNPLGTRARAVDMGWSCWMGNYTDNRQAHFMFSNNSTNNTSLLLLLLVLTSRRHSQVIETCHKDQVKTPHSDRLSA